jgi:RES domain-containing protein
MTVYRAHDPKWAWAPESGAGAALYGGRFNPVGIDALYTSQTFQTAWLEAQQGLPYKAQPMTLCGYDIDCESILDLTDNAVRTANGVTIGLERPRDTQDRATLLDHDEAADGARRCRHHRPKFCDWRYVRGCQCDILDMERLIASPGEGHR